VPLRRLVAAPAYASPAGAAAPAVHLAVGRKRKPSRRTTPPAPCAPAAARPVARAAPPRRLPRPPSRRPGAGRPARPRAPGRTPRARRVLAEARLDLAPARCGIRAP
jgi:hypothetical protein